MKDTQVFSAALQHRSGEDIHVLHALIFLKVDEALSLYTRHIEDVNATDNLRREVRRLRKRNTCTATEVLALLGHHKLRRRDKDEVRAEGSHTYNERMHGTAILQVTNQCNGLIVESALRLAYRIEVQQSL